MKLWWCTALILASLTLPFAAQAEEAAPPPTKQENIKALLRLAGVFDQMPRLLDNLLPLIRRGSGPMSDEEWQTFEAEFRLEFSEARILESFGPVYDRHYSERELAEIVAFYQSPLGRKVVANQPAIYAECTAIGERMGEDSAKRAMDKLQQRQNGAQPKKGATQR